MHDPWFWPLTAATLAAVNTVILIANTVIFFRLRSALRRMEGKA